MSRVVVIGAGMALYVLMLSTFESLDATQHAYYDRYRFADVFASCKRAPLRLEKDLREIPGVSAVRTRVVVDVTLDIPDLPEPAVARLVSVPERGRPALNDFALLRGRYPEPGRGDEEHRRHREDDRRGPRSGDSGQPGPDVVERGDRLFAEDGYGHVAVADELAVGDRDVAARRRDVGSARERGDEAEPPYSRMAIPYFLIDKIDENLRAAMEKRRAA